MTRPRRPHSRLELPPPLSGGKARSAGSGVVETSHAPNEDAIAIFGDSILYVNLDECTSCTACYQPDVCPVGAIYSEEHVPDGSANHAYNSADANKGHDHTFFIQHNGAVFAD